MPSITLIGRSIEASQCGSTRDRPAVAVRGVRSPPIAGPSPCVFWFRAGVRLIDPSRGVLAADGRPEYNDPIGRSTSCGLPQRLRAGLGPRACCLDGPRRTSNAAVADKTMIGEKSRSRSRSTETVTANKGIMVASPTSAIFHVNWLSPAKMRHTIIGGSKRNVVSTLNPVERIKIGDCGIQVEQWSETRSSILVGHGWAMCPPTCRRGASAERGAIFC